MHMILKFTDGVWNNMLNFLFTHLLLMVRDTIIYLYVFLDPVI